jgi:hypothetical protein
MEAATEALSPNEEIKVIGRNEVAVKKLKLNHALTLIESTGNEFANEALAMRKLHELTESKTQIKNLAKNLLLESMMKRASELEVKYADTNGNLFPVTTYSEIGQAWKQNASKANASKLYDIMYGHFEKGSIYWREQMEKEIMNKLKIKYSDNTIFCNKETGCVSKIITTAKNEIIKNINRAGLLHHGKRVGISNARGEGKKKKRRKHGVFMDCFVRAPVKKSGSSDSKVRMSRYFLNMWLTFHVLT